MPLTNTQANFHELHSAEGAKTKHLSPKPLPGLAKPLSGLSMGNERLNPKPSTLES